MPFHTHRRHNGMELPIVELERFKAINDLG